MDIGIFTSTVDLREKLRTIHEEQHQNQRDSKRVCAVEAPIGTDDIYVFKDELPANAGHDEAD
jgi:hypothetical protein